jgi:hypothetical protein
MGSLSSKKPSQITPEKEAVASPTSIHMVPQKDFAIGVCVVCGQPAVLNIQVLGLSFHDAMRQITGT